MKIRGRRVISQNMQVKITNFMQVALALTTVYGLYIGRTGITVNAGVGLLITYVPTLLERNQDIVLDPLLTLWITSAVFFHGIGTLGPYGQIPWWDNFTHVLSSSVVAAVGYSVFRSFDLHTDEIEFPDRFLFVFILAFVMAFGVIWELLEFGISGLAENFGTNTVLTQYSLEDTMTDLVYDSIGGIAVALFGEIYLSGLVGQIGERVVQED